MKQLTTIEKCAFALALAFIGAGLIMVFKPAETVVPHFTSDALGLNSDSTLEIVSKKGAEIHGGLMVVMGLGIGLLAVYRGRS
jgi:hypothetical protein